MANSEWFGCRPEIYSFACTTIANATPLRQNRIPRVSLAVRRLPSSRQFREVCQLQVHLPKTQSPPSPGQPGGRPATSCASFAGVPRLPGSLPPPCEDPAILYEGDLYTTR